MRLQYSAQCRFCSYPVEKIPHLILESPALECPERYRLEVAMPYGSKICKTYSVLEVLLSNQRSRVDVSSIVQNTAFSLIPSIIQATLGDLSGNGYLGETKLSDDFYSHVKELVVKKVLILTNSLVNFCMSTKRSRVMNLPLLGFQIPDVISFQLAMMMMMCLYLEFLTVLKQVVALLPRSDVSCADSCITKRP